MFWGLGCLQITNYKGFGGILHVSQEEKISTAERSAGDGG